MGIFTGSQLNNGFLFQGFKAINTFVFRNNVALVNRDAILIHRDPSIPLTIFHVPNRAPHPTREIFYSQPAIFIANKDILLALAVTSIKLFLLYLQLALPALMEPLQSLNIFLPRFIQPQLKTPRPGLRLCPNLPLLSLPFLFPNQILLMLFPIRFPLKKKRFTPDHLMTVLSLPNFILNNILFFQDQLKPSPSSPLAVFLLPLIFLIPMQLTHGRTKLLPPKTYISQILFALQGFDGLARPAVVHRYI